LAQAVWLWLHAMARGKYASYFKDERRWKQYGDKGIFYDAERHWRTEWTSVGSEHLECPLGSRFKREPTADKPPDRGGWSCRGLKTSFRDKSHEKDPRGDLVDEGALKAWRKAVSADPSQLRHAPRTVIDDREAKVCAALGACRRTEQALYEAAMKLSDNRNVMLDLLYQDYEVLKVAAEQLRGDRRHLIHDVRSVDFSDLRARAKELEVERKELLSELSGEISSLDRNSDSLRSQRDAELLSLRKNRQTIETHMEELKNDGRLQWVRTHWDGLEHLHHGLADDRDMIVQEVLRFWPGVKYVAKHVQDDRKILLEAVQPHLAARTVEDAAAHESHAYWTSEAILDVVMEDSSSMASMEKKMRQSRATVNQVIKDDWSNLQKATDIMRADRALIVAVAENTMADGRW